MIDLYRVQRMDCLYLDSQPFQEHFWSMSFHFVGHCHMGLWQPLSVVQFGTSPSGFLGPDSRAPHGNGKKKFKRWSISRISG